MRDYVRKLLPRFRYGAIQPRTHRVLDLLRETKERTGISADAPLEALIAALNHLGLTKLAIGSRWAKPVNDAIKHYLEAGGIDVVGMTKRNQWASDSFAMTMEQGLEMALDVGRPAFTNMSPKVWDDLVRPGIIPPVQGWGRLLAGA